ncbi:hypothetical protein WJU23_14720 [Prosthecobacter sp. SYSU 5D2]|uniref:hypothetical protein n=1 Tax=Prosthecobacter sp. SYSU 5D2 TaxID=3134134 RepID=UPI0031FF19CB
MKTSLQLLILSISLHLIAGAAADDIRHEPAVVASPADDYIAICGWEFDTDGGGYSTCSVDLNGDGLKDHLFANASTSGTGGQAATVYLGRKDGQFTRIGTLGHGAIATEALSTGATLLHCSWNGGGGNSAITTYLISNQGLMQIDNIQGKWNDEAYQKKFAHVFASPLKAEYRFVATQTAFKSGEK